MSKSQLITLIIIIACLGLLVAACGSAPDSYKGTVIDPPLPTEDFSLIDQDGQTFRLSDQPGQITMLFFGYASCPDVCPTTLATWHQVYQALGAEADQVRFILITVDPERDTPAQMKQYVRLFNPRFIGLTGSPESLDSVYARYGIFREREAQSETAAGYLVSHTGSTYVLDAQARRVLLHRFGTPAEDIVHDLKQLLN